MFRQHAHKQTKTDQNRMFISQNTFMQHTTVQLIMRPRLFQKLFLVKT